MNQPTLKRFVRLDGHALQVFHHPGFFDFSAAIPRRAAAVA